MKFFSPVTSLLLSLGLLGSLAAYRVVAQVAPADAGAFHRQARQAADAQPLWVGDWVGTNVELVPGAVALLHPNAQVCRNYSNLRTGRAVSMMIIQCEDARDILGHYPPVCYVAHGWSKASEGTPRRWTIADHPVSGMEYEYSRVMKDQVVHVFIDDFFLLPDGTTCPDMPTVSAHARGYRSRFFGATQVQVQFDAAVPEAERREIFSSLLGGHAPVLERMGLGGKS